MENCSLQKQNEVSGPVLDEGKINPRAKVFKAWQKSLLSRGVKVFTSPLPNAWVLKNFCFLGNSKRITVAFSMQGSVSCNSVPPFN